MRDDDAIAMWFTSEILRFAQDDMSLEGSDGFEKTSIDQPLCERSRPVAL
jgi:hypothetical protein